jgi:heme/copper-type cytochrome/quinol oxidase subunit 2
MANFSIPQIRSDIMNDPENPVTSDIETGGTSSGTGVGTSWNWGLKQTDKSDPNIFIFNAIVLFLYVLSILTALTFIWAGVKYITAGGDAEKAESAKKIIYGSLVGMLIILGSFAIFKFSVNALNAPPSDTQAVQQLMNQP